MPRYVDVDTISFTRPLSGDKVPVKDIRPRPAYTDASIAEVGVAKTIDEICVRQEVYGADSESSSYKIYERNEAAIVDNGYSIIGLRNLVVPL